MDRLKHKNGRTRPTKLEIRGNEFHKSSKIKTELQQKDVDKLGSPFRMLN